MLTSRWITHTVCIDLCADIESSHVVSVYRAFDAILLTRHG